MVKFRSEATKGNKYIVIKLVIDKERDGEEILKKLKV